MFPNVGQAMVEVLERLGCETFLPEQQVCCGQPTYNSGYSKGSMKTFKNEIDALLSIDADYIVGPTGSCVFMIKEYPEILADAPRKRPPRFTSLPSLFTGFSASLTAGPNSTPR